MCCISRPAITRVDLMHWSPWRHCTPPRSTHVFQTRYYCFISKVISWINDLYFRPEWLIYKIFITAFHILNMFRSNWPSSEGHLGNDYYIVNDIVQCWGLLDQFWPPIVLVTPLKTPVGLLITLLQSSPSRNYNHSQLFLTLLRVYTSIILTRQYSILS
jgi:hypothetical protein